MTEYEERKRTLELKPASPADVLCGLSTSIYHYEELLTERVVGKDTLRQAELADMADLILLRALTEETKQGLAKLDVVEGGLATTDSPRVRLSRATRTLRAMATERLSLPQNLEGNALLPCCFDGGVSFDGDIWFNGILTIDGSINFRPSPIGASEKSHIKVSVGRLQNFTDLIHYTLSQDEEGCDHPEQATVETFSITETDIEDSPFSTEDILQFLRGLKKEYALLASLPASYLVEIFNSFKETAEI